MRVYHYVELIFIVCGNDDGFHDGDSNKYHLRSIVIDGSIYNEPDEEQAQDLMDNYPDHPILMIVSPCNSCRAKGITTKPKMITIDRSEEEGGD